jgi:hypothetical protein
MGKGFSFVLCVFLLSASETYAQYYGELYVTPEQDISDVSTTFLAGLTVSPAKEFNVRLLMSPSVRASFEGVSVSNFQWRLGVNLYP